MILLIDNYDSFTFNVYQLIEQLGHRCEVVRNDAITLEEIARMRPERLVISPGPGNPDSAGISLDAIREFAGKIPILGVCLGHQAIGQVYGGRVVRASKPRHGKVSRVKHDGRGLYAGMKGPFLAARYHSLVVDRRSLPSCLEVTSETDDRTIMGIRHRELPVEGVQFHPESVATENGERMMRNFLENFTRSR